MTTVDGPVRRRRLVWPILGAVVVVAGGASAWLWAGNGSTEAAPAAGVPAATATVERGTIALTRSWEGTLDHGRPDTVASPAEGTITGLPDQGATVERGDELYRIDERPVILLYGPVPMYRNLRPGDAGSDVEQLETNLAELGYDGFTADDEYTGATAEAVRAWQADNGGEPTGAVGRGEVVFVPEARQVDSLRARVGDLVRPGTPVLDLTGTDQLVSLEADLDDRDLLEVGAEVRLLLPSGGETAGTVSTASVVEVAAEGGDGATESLVQVEITVAEPVPDQGAGTAVTVMAAVEERPDVLLVPVNALLALAEGGYGLEVVADDGTASIVAVDVGLFADGKVEIRSAVVAEGAVVGVAGR